MAHTLHGSFCVSGGGEQSFVRWAKLPLLAGNAAVTLFCESALLATHSVEKLISFFFFIPIYSLLLALARLSARTGSRKQK
jgi:hypothetical protein